MKKTIFLLLLIFVVGCQNSLLLSKCEELRNLTIENRNSIEELNTDFGYNMSYKNDIKGYNKLCGDVTGKIESKSTEEKLSNAPEGYHYYLINKTWKLMKDTDVPKLNITTDKCTGIGNIGCEPDCDCASSPRKQFELQIENASLGIGKPFKKFPRILVDCEGIKNISGEFLVYHWVYTDCAILDTLIYEDYDFRYDNETGLLKGEPYFANLKSFNKSFYEYGICYIVKNQSVGYC